MIGNGLNEQGGAVIFYTRKSVWRDKEIWENNNQVYYLLRE